MICKGVEKMTSKSTEDMNEVIVQKVCQELEYLENFKNKHFFKVIICFPAMIQTHNLTFSVSKKNYLVDI